jgi:hypothetical protein
MLALQKKARAAEQGIELSAEAIALELAPLDAASSSFRAAFLNLSLLGSTLKELEALKPVRPPATCSRRPRLTPYAAHARCGGAS